MTDETICTTCNGFDTYISNGDNHCCRECGDTEGLIFESDYTEEEWEQLTKEAV